MIKYKKESTWKVNDSNNFVTATRRSIKNSGKQYIGIGNEA